MHVGPCLYYTKFDLWFWLSQFTRRFDEISNVAYHKFNDLQLQNVFGLTINYVNFSYFDHLAWLWNVQYKIDTSMFERIMTMTLWLKETKHTDERSKQ